MRHLRVRQKPIIYVLTAAILLFSMIGNPMWVNAAEQTESEEQVAVTEQERASCLYYVALGDSIPNGYCAEEGLEIVSYPELLAAHICEISGEEMELSKETKNGLTTVKLNKVVLKKPEVQEELRKADVVTMTIGANDLMNQFKKVSREILNNEAHFHTADEALQALQAGVKENPLLLVKIVGAISNWDYDSFEKQWEKAVETINSMRPEGSQFVVTTMYNPAEKMELPGTLNAIVNSLISKMNDIIWSHMDEYGYQVVELMDSEIGGLTQSDGLHPNQSGQELICALTEAQMNLKIFEDIRVEKEAEAAAEQAAKEAEELAKKEAQEKAEKEKAAEKERQERKAQRKQEMLSLAGLAAAIGLMVMLKKSEEKKQG